MNRKSISNTEHKNNIYPMCIINNKHTIWLEYLRQTQIQYLLIAAAKEINYICVGASHSEQTLPNQSSPRQLQRPMVRAPPSGKNIKMRMSHTLAPVPTTLA
jgi:hypothetical protein